MHLLKMASKWMSNATPLGWIIAGTAVIAATPVLKNALRGVAVTATRGVLSVAEGAAAIGSNAREGWEDLVAEAKAQKGAGTAGASSMDMNTVVGAGAGGAIGATIGGGMAGATGAMVGGGLGSVVGAGVGSGLSEHAEHAGHTAQAHANDKAAKGTHKTNKTE